MHVVALPVSFRWDEAFVARVDEARGDVPRSVFVRRAVERALGDEMGDATSPEARVRSREAGMPSSPAPAVQPEASELERKGLENLVREFRPYPKGGKR